MIAPADMHLMDFLCEKRAGALRPNMFTASSPRKRGSSARSRKRPDVPIVALDSRLRGNDENAWDWKRVWRAAS